MTDYDKVKEKLVRVILGQVPCESELEGKPNSCPDRKYGLCKNVERIDICAAKHLADQLIANGIVIEPQTKQGPVYGDYIRCKEDDVPEAKKLLLEQMVATIRELAKKDDFFEVIEIDGIETAEKIKVAWKFSIPHMKA